MSYISNLGIRNGEYITSAPTAKQNTGTVIQIFGFYPPEKNNVLNIPPLFIRDNLNSYDFFSSLSYDERYNWLINNSTDKHDTYLEQYPLKLKFSTISGKFMIDQLGNNVQTLLNPNPNDPEGLWSIRDVLNMFPKKIGSKKDSLIFRPSNWILMPKQNKITSFSGFIVNNGTFYMGLSEDVLIHKMLQSNFIPEIGLEIPRGNFWNYIDDAWHDLSFYDSFEVFKEISQTIEWFTPSIHKSLIQKVIRTRCKEVFLQEKRWKSSSVLIVSFAMLLFSPGSFVPNIQRFVGGVESATKRLAISICEDSFTENSSFILSLYGAALIAQNDRSWKPSSDLVKAWIVEAVKSQQDTRLFKYENFNGAILEYNNYSISYLLLQEIRSFQGDIDLVGSIYSNNGMSNPIIESPQINIPLFHCIDQHSLTEIALFMDYGPSFEETFHNIWDYVVGVNPRKEKYAEYAQSMEDNSYVKQVRKAQNNVWLRHTQKLILRDELSKTVNFSYQVDQSLISGLIGPVEISFKNLNVIVVLRTDDIYSYNVVKKPTRGDKNIIVLTEQDKEEAISIMISKLQQGIILNKVSKYFNYLQGSIIYFCQDNYIISYKGNNILWNDFVKMKYVIPYHISIELTLENACLYTGNGVETNSKSLFDELVIKTPKNILSRVIYYIRGYNSHIKINPIARNGKGSELSVVPEDSGVFQFLCYMCIIYPIAIEIDISGFTIKNGPIFWNLRNKLLNILKTPSFSHNWKLPIPDNRILFEHQKEALDKMISRNLNNKRGNILYLEVGLGKTLIIIKYIMYLIENQKMPPYSVYTVPKSAFDSIIREFNSYSIPINIIDMTSSTKILIPNSINLVNHDHLRLNGLDKQLRDLAPQMLFIIDEFHKTLNNTIRTSIALEISELSYDFIALSGTIITTGDVESIKGLIYWLSQIVEFEVTLDNYWVAIGSLISNKIKSNIVVIREDIGFPINDPEYLELLPKSMGGYGNFLRFRDAIAFSYFKIIPALFETIIKYYNLGERVFVVAKDSEMQNQLYNLLNIYHQYTYLITNTNPLTYDANDSRDIRIVITTPTHSVGYTLTKIRVMITSVYFGNQATRTQLEGRINRIGQWSSEIKVITVHAGILSKIFERYENVRSLAKILEDFSKDVIIN